MSVTNRNGRTLLMLLGVILFTGGAAWASVPLYDWFCRVTGYGGATVTAEAASDEILDQTIKVRFDASIEREMPWDFKPVEREIEVRIGESVIAFYEAKNPTNIPIAGTASYNVYPFSAGGYFVKIDCFCFEEQVLQPGESVLMPVNFYVDPDILNDKEASSSATITLSYTFHKTDLPSDTESASIEQTISNKVRDI